MLLRTLFLSILVLAALFPAGCENKRLERPSLEDLEMVGVLGFDKSPQDRIKVTISVPQPTKGGFKKDQIYTGEGSLTHEAFYKISAMSAKSVSLRQTRVILIGEELARGGGLKDILMDLYRDPQVGNNGVLAIVKGSAESILKNTAPKQNSEFLNDLLRPREETAFSPYTTLRDFIFVLTNEVSDPMIPYIEATKQSIKISKIALFKKDHLVGFMNPGEAQFIEMLRKEKRFPSITVPFTSSPSMHGILLLNLMKSQVRTKVTGDLNDPVIFSKLELEAVIQDYKGKLNLESQKELKMVEQNCEEYIRDQIKDVLKKLQSMQVDPVGFGRYARMKFGRDWPKMRQKFVSAESDAMISVKITLRNTGTMK